MLKILFVIFMLLWMVEYRVLLYRTRRALEDFDFQSITLHLRCFVGALYTLTMEIRGFLVFLWGSCVIMYRLHSMEVVWVLFEETYPKEFRNDYIQALRFFK